MTSRISAVDLINRRSMRNAVEVYARFDTLGPAEVAALNSVAERVAGGSVLDIGVGGGRTVSALRELSTDYIGIDYVTEMVEACRVRFPGVRFEHADARAMPQFADASFDLVVFAWAGICMIDHPGRLAILGEIHRLLKPGGAFIFSSYNQNSSAYTSWFKFPEFQWSSAPGALIRSGTEFVRSLLARVINRVRFLPKEVRTPNFGIINDLSHDYGTMLYYISLENQLKQLRAAGFNAEINVYDSLGNTAKSDCTDDSLMYVAIR